METSCTSKKLKPAEPERVPPAPVEMDEPDEMMVCEDSTAKENNAGQMEATTESSQAMLVPKHCNGICEYVIGFLQRIESNRSLLCVSADASPTTLIMRCYCDPYRLNALIPYNSDIY